ncbi:MAG TPA: hypothetical protein VEI04_09185 [Syntrophobacteria bacterium]|nr:hypothetical protein [Syntrophobacteria bacterium]
MFLGPHAGAGKGQREGQGPDPHGRGQGGPPGAPATDSVGGGSEGPDHRRGHQRHDRGLGPRQPRLPGDPRGEDAGARGPAPPAP